MSQKIFLPVLFWSLLLTGVACGQQKKAEKLADPQALARLLPFQWMGMNLLSDKTWSRRKIAQLEISVANADYTAKDYSREGSFEIVDALRSPMHLNEFTYGRDSAARDNVESWKGPWGEGYVIQDPVEDETRARLLVRGRWFITVNQSPRENSAALRAALEAWLADEKVKSLLK